MSSNSMAFIKNALAASFLTLSTLLLVELALRVQPFVPLKYSEKTLNPGLRISFEHHHNVLHIPAAQYASIGDGCNKQGKQLKILFMGDSWMELTDGIPRGVAESLLEKWPTGLCVQIVNGGTTSFSPSLILIKGEHLIAEHRPDFVVVNIDETDLMDEYLRYRKTTLRDQAGRIERVVPNVVDTASIYQRAVLNQQPLYTLRLLEQVYYDEVLLPRLRSEYFGIKMQIGAYELIMSPQVSKDPRTTHVQEIAYFSQVLREMIERLAARLPPNRLLLTHHPHLLHLSQGDQPAHYNNLVADIVREETQGAKGTKTTFYDAQRDVKELYGDNAASFFMQNDPFSHLTPEGYRRYGRFIGRTLQPLVVAVVSP